MLNAPRVVQRVILFNFCALSVLCCVLKETSPAGGVRLTHPVSKLLQMIHSTSRLKAENCKKGLLNMDLHHGCVGCMNTIEKPVGRVKFLL